MKYTEQQAAAMLARTAPAAKNKYGATRVQVDGIWFDSKAEAKRYNELKLMQKAGIINGLHVHPSFNIWINTSCVCVVELDFSYREKDAIDDKYEDVKGKDNPLSALKRKLVEAFYGIKVELIK